MSSGYDRTLETAEAVALGLYPPNTADMEERNSTWLPDHHIVIPIHSEDPENDGEAFLLLFVFVLLAECRWR